MYGMFAYDPFTEALVTSAKTLSVEDMSNLQKLTVELLNAYEGNQYASLRSYLGSLIKNPVLRARYQELAVFHNIVRLLVDRVTTIGQLPIPVIWKNPDGTVNLEANEKWYRIATEKMGAAPWDALIPSIGRKTELTKTVLAAPSWNSKTKSINVNVYTPNLLSVGYEPDNLDRTSPDRYYILIDEATNLWQVWDFSGETGIVYETDVPESKPKNYRTIDIIDPVTEASLNPFVAFRTDIPTDSFFLSDGQLELLSAQIFINRCFTQLSVQLHFGAFKIPIAKGTNWNTPEGESPKITLDPSEILILPSGTLDGNNPELKWDGPATKEVIDSLLSVINHWIEAVAATFRISPSAIRAKNEAASGYSLQVENAALKGKHEASRTLFRAPLTDLARKIRLVWDNANPKEKFPEGVYPTVLIPNWSSAVTVREEVESDLKLLEAGLVEKKTLILKYNPGISPEELEALAEEEEPEVEEPPVVPAGFKISPTSPEMDPVPEVEDPTKTDPEELPD